MERSKTLAGEGTDQIGVWTAAMFQCPIDKRRKYITDKVWRQVHEATIFTALAKTDWPMGRIGAHEITWVHPITAVISSILEPMTDS